MPRNFKEAMFFTTMMCAMMVFGMSAWNLFVQGAFSWKHLFLGFIPGFIVAFLLDVLIVGPIAKGFAGKLPFDHTKRWKKIFAISSSMVIGMVTFMSIYGLFMNPDAGFSFTNYFKTWGTNFIAAYPLNFIIVGPISRYILGHLQKTFDGEDKVEDFENDEEMPTII